MSTDSEPPQPKYSRYRSVRQAAAIKSRSPSNTETPVEAQNEAIQRSRSRYHRRPGTTSPVANHIASMPPIPQHLPTLQSLEGENGAPIRSRAHEPRSIPPAPVSGEKALQRRDHKESSLSDPRTRGRTELRENGNQTVNSAQERSLLSQGEPEKQARAQLSEEDDVTRLLAIQKQKDLKRLEAELAVAAARSSSSPEGLSPSASKFGGEKFSLFTRKRAESKAALSKSSSSGAASETTTYHKSQDTPEAKADGQPWNIIQGGGGVVPGIDAPKSAVNAGERRVLIRCKQSSINLPVNPDTTPVDLLHSAANVLSVMITPSASILLESYTKLGLERRIRRYEHIRDIMNSWDRDTQNALVIQASDSPAHDFDLDTSSVPKEQPKDVRIYMYHSQKLGKWSKRYVTLLSTGQIFISKKKDAKASDKDIVTLCHLTDFDIYTPTTDELRKNLRPPKKYCYAVKSQQKTSMFLNTENFVHYFSTDNYDLANAWYDACQQWRSWYLVKIKGEGQKKQGANSKTVKAPDMRTKSGSNIIAGHKVTIPVDEGPYTIGSFKPLMDLNRFESANPDPNNETEKDEPRRVPFHLRNGTTAPISLTRRDHQPPPVSYPRHLQPSNSDDPIDTSTFAPSGLLGRTYSQRQRAQKERELAEKINGPFTSGPSLLNSPETHRPQIGTASDLKKADQLSPTLGQGGHKRTPSISTRAPRPQTSAGTVRQRSPTRCRLSEAKPLVDLTPKFVEAPQWSREGKGHGVAAPSGVPLVEAATGPQGQGLMEAVGPGVLFRRG